MEITKYIYDYLMEYNTPVVVPNLGCFSIVNKPSEIKDGVVIPPVKTVELDSENSLDDNVLTLYIAKKENITMVQAADEIRNFYNHFFINKLSFQRRVSFDNFGEFTLNEFSNIIFTPDANFFKDYYGLGDVSVQGDATHQPQPDDIFDTPEPAPYTPISPEPVIEEPSQPVSESTQDVPVSEVDFDTLSESEGSLFDATDSTRFRENTERRRQASDRAEEPVRPIRKGKTPPPLKTGQATMRTDGHPNIWVLWVVIAAAVLGVACYYIYPMFTSNNTTLKTIVDAGNEANLQNAETAGDTLNTDVAQTLDDATDKKNALNPAQSSASSTSEPSTKAASGQSTPKTQAKPVATDVQSQGNVGHGAYVLVIGSFTTHSAAETHGKKLKAAGIHYEIIDAGNQRYRVSVASYDDKAEAIRQANQIKSKPFCENVWVTRR